MAYFHKIALDSNRNVIELFQKNGSPVTLPNLDGQVLVNQNFAINGGFHMWQRSTATVNIPLNSDTYVNVDRWRFAYSATTGWSTPPTVGRNQTGPNNKTKYAVQITTTTTVADSSQVVAMNQRIEANNARVLSGYGVCSVSLWIWSNSATTCQLAGYTPTSEDTFSGNVQFYQQNQTIPAGNWTLLKWEGIALPVNAVNGIQFNVRLLNFGTGTGTHYISQVNVNQGYRCSDFSLAGGTMAGEVAACYRYAAISNLNAQIMSNQVGTANIWFQCPLPVQLRATPTIFGSGLVVYTIGNVAQSGFTFGVSAYSNASGVLVVANKNAHGLSNAFLYFTDNVTGFDADL